MHSNETKKPIDETDSIERRDEHEAEHAIDFDKIDYSSIFIERGDEHHSPIADRRSRTKSFEAERGDREQRGDHESAHEHFPLEAAARGLDKSVELHEKTIAAMHEFVRHVEKLSERQARIEHDLQTLRSWNQRVQIRGLNHFNY